MCYVIRPYSLQIVAHCITHSGNLFSFFFVFCTIKAVIPNICCEWTAHFHILSFFIRFQSNVHYRNIGVIFDRCCSLFAWIVLFIFKMPCCLFVFYSIQVAVMCNDCVLLFFLVPVGDIKDLS